jgi:hypothetical protein
MSTIYFRVNIAWHETKLSREELDAYLDKNKEYKENYFIY